MSTSTRHTTFRLPMNLSNPTRAFPLLRSGCSDKPTHACNAEHRTSRTYGCLFRRWSKRMINAELATPHHRLQRHPPPRQPLSQLLLPLQQQHPLPTKTKVWIWNTIRRTPKTVVFTRSSFGDQANVSLDARLYRRLHGCARSREQ